MPRAPKVTPDLEPEQNTNDPVVVENTDATPRGVVSVKKDRKTGKTTTTLADGTVIREN